MKPKNQDKALAEQYGVTTRSIRNWRSQGAPLGDAQALKIWLTSRRTIPPATRERLENAPGPTAKPKIRRKTVETPPGDQGAGPALGRLESAEEKTWRTFEAAMADGNPALVRASRESWLEVSAELRKYDRQLSLDRRRASAMVPREQVEQLLKSFGFLIRIGTVQCAQSVAPRLVGADINSALTNTKDGLTSSLYQCCVSLAANLEQTRSRIPRWMLDVFLSEVIANVSDGAKDLQIDEQQFNALFRATVAARLGDMESLDKLLTQAFGEKALAAISEAS
jgi:hypothetical protein